MSSSKSLCAAAPVDGGPAIGYRWGMVPPSRSRRATPWGGGRLAEDAEARFVEGADYCGRFFMGQADAQRALYKVTAILEADGLPYAIIGAFALNEYGHRRVTVDVDLVMRDDDLQAFKRNHLGRGYVERVPGTGKAPGHRARREHRRSFDRSVSRRRQAQTHRFP